MFSWFFPKKPATEADALETLKYLRFTSDIDFFMKVLKEAKMVFPNIHKALLATFSHGEVLEASVGAIRAMMIEWPEDLTPVMVALLKTNCVVASMAMGTEKTKYCTSYYRLVQEGMKMNLNDFRVYLVGLRKLWDVVSRTYPSTIPYSICLFGEPLAFSITCAGMPITTVYKGSVKKHEYIYDPVESLLETPLTQSGLDLCVKNSQKPVLVITSCVDEGLVLPEDVWVIFTQSTKSYGKRIVPFFNEKGHSVLKNFLNFIAAL